jgi:Cu+-exporting ATPase
VTQEKNIYDLPIPEESEIILGEGVSCKFRESGKTFHVRVGNEKLMQRTCPEFSPPQIDVQFQNSGKTVVYIALGDSVVGSIAVSDSVKPESPEVIRKLKSDGYEIWMMTGDHPATAHVIATQLGIEHVLAGATPADKAAKISELQEEGKHVIMVGDGINDSLALATADASGMVLLHSQSSPSPPSSLPPSLLSSPSSTPT